jgi:hypothetical protein
VARPFTFHVIASQLSQLTVDERYKPSGSVFSTLAQFRKHAGHIVVI